MVRAPCPAVTTCSRRPGSMSAIACVTAVRSRSLDTINLLHLCIHPDSQAYVSAHLPFRSIRADPTAATSGTADHGDPRLGRSGLGPKATWSPTASASCREARPGAGRPRRTAGPWRALVLQPVDRAGLALRQHDGAGVEDRDPISATATSRPVQVTHGHPIRTSTARANTA
jgi:hypothetical protein